ncbi:MAG: hypothetical protein K940chlam3_00212 [Chlamydiae bacterium]|nr:hypothetical protein [Chlamydiota bacterium]
MNHLLSSSTLSTSNTVTLSFGWSGPTSKYGGKLSVDVVDLIFKNSSQEISVHIPEDLSPDGPHKLSFSCREGYRSSVSESLKATIDQVKNLTLNAGFFEESTRNSQYTTMDRFGRITPELRYPRTDETVKLEYPPELAAGRKYRIVCTSDDLSLSAQLIQETSTEESHSTSEAELTPEQAEFCESLTLSLLPAFNIFAENLASILTTFNHRVTIDRRPDRGLDVLCRQIKKIDSEALVKLIAEYSAIDENCKNYTPSTELTELEKQTLRMCIVAITNEGFEEMVQLFLKSIFIGSMSPSVNEVIENTSKSLSENFIKEVMS